MNQFYNNIGSFQTNILGRMIFSPHLNIQVNLIFKFLVGIEWGIKNCDYYIAQYFSITSHNRNKYVYNPVNFLKTQTIYSYNYDELKYGFDLWKIHYFLFIVLEHPTKALDSHLLRNYILHGSSTRLIRTLDLRYGLKEILRIMELISLIYIETQRKP